MPTQSKEDTPPATRRASGPRRGRRGARLATAAASDFTPEEVEFMAAVDQYKRDHCRPHPDWHEILDVAISLGYKLSAEPANRRQAFVFRLRRLDQRRAFVAAMAAHILMSDCAFPTCRDALLVLYALGYRKPLSASRRGCTNG